MPIVIKEVIVKTTVEHKVPQWSDAHDKSIVEEIKKQVMAELPMEGLISKIRRNKNNR